jgi:hypothetical protein
MEESSIAATVRQLVTMIGVASADVVDLPAAIAILVRCAAEHEIDPYVTLGILIESISYTVARSIPPSKKTQTATDVVRLLLDRLQAARPLG